jgi:dipeptidyl aminopeptidase/acylaminoacyl peptidase
MKKRVLLLSFIAAAALTSSAAEFANVEYLCADWGPAMTLPSKPGDKPQFSDMDEEIYFLKQVTARGKVGIYLCKMKPDGSDKTEIKELWKDPNYPIETDTQSTWMNVNGRTGKIAVSVLFAGSDITGLWTVNLDGNYLRRAITPTLIDGRLQAIDSPSWTPDGQWIVFGESLRGVGHSRIAKCDANGKNVVYLTDGLGDSQPRISPDGTEIVYVHNPMKRLGTTTSGDEMWVAATLWLTSPDGSNKREIPNPEAKPSWPTKGISGAYPAWSPDGTKIYAVSAGIIKVVTGTTLLRKSPRSINPEGKTVEQYSNVVMPHWGKQGLLCSGWGGGITVVDDQFETQRILASSGKAAMK